MSIATLNDIFFAAAEHNLDHAMLYRESGKWVPISSSEIARKVAGTAQGLKALGVRKGDRIAILSENRPAWLVGRISPVAREARPAASVSSLAAAPIS